MKMSTCPVEEDKDASIFFLEQHTVEEALELS